MRSVLIGMVTFIALLLFAVSVFPQDLATPYAWSVDRQHPEPFSRHVQRGETILLQPSFPGANLSGATVTFRRYLDGYNGLTLTGSLLSAETCQVRIDTSTNWTQSPYQFEITVSSSSSAMIRATGSLIIDPGILFASPVELEAGVADPIAVPYTRKIDRKNPSAWILPARRGETLSITARYVDDQTPVDLTHAYAAWFRYRGLSATNGYAIPCEFVNRTNGQLTAVWTPANELADSTYVWDIIVSGATSSMIRAFGSLTLSPSIGYVNPTNRPTTLSLLDMATVQIVNIGSAPWLSSYEIDDVRRYIAGLEDGSASLDVGSLTIGGVPILPLIDQAITGLTVSGYGSLNRTGPHTAELTITGGGGSGGSGKGGGIGSYTNTSINGSSNTNSIMIADSVNVSWAYGTDGVWRATAAESVDLWIAVSNIVTTAALLGQTAYGWGDHRTAGYLTHETDPAWSAVSNGVTTSALRGESAFGWGDHRLAGYMTQMPTTWSSTGAVYWVVDGVQIGRVDSNGITMLRGSLQLQEQDLNCNVRIYDGSRTAPCLTPYGHTNTIGMYVRGYMGSWGFGFSHAGKDILTINSGGLSMLMTNAAISGRIIGDLSSCSNYPEPLFFAYKTNMVYAGFTIQTNGVLTMQHSPFGFDAIVLNASNSTACFYDDNQTKRVNVDGNNGIVTLRDSVGSIKWEASSASSFFSGVRTQFTVNAARTVTVTNVITYVYGQVTKFTQQ